MAQYSLQGRTLFITGGASGIGAEVARKASARGASVALVDVDGDGAKRVAKSLPNAIAIQADVRDYFSLEDAARETVGRFGGIDITLANAGIEIAHTCGAVPLIEMERIADINFTGVFRTVRATLPFVTERRGYILITASLAAILHAPPLAHYAATKAGVEAFGNALRMETRHKGVDVGVAYFGFIDTPMVQRGKSDPILQRFEEQNGQNFIGKTYPLSSAAAAVIKGIEGRKRRVMYPSFIRPLSVLRAAMPRFLERATKPQVVAELVDAIDDRDLRHGDAPDPSRMFHEQLFADTPADKYDRRPDETKGEVLS